MDEANERKMAKTFNMIVLGGLLKIRPIVSIESVVKALRKTLPERHHHLIPMNEEAIRIGMDIIKESLIPYRKHTSIITGLPVHLQKEMQLAAASFSGFHF